MSSIVISGDTSGSISLAAPAVAGSNTITLPAATAPMPVMQLATAQNSTSGTSIDFTGIPSWVKRITVMLNSCGLSTTAAPMIQIGSGSILTSGYTSLSSAISGNSAGQGAGTGTGFQAMYAAVGGPFIGVITLVNMGSNIWLAQGGLIGISYVGKMQFEGGVTLSGVLDRLRVTTTAGTASFNAGSINILYEGY